MARKKKKGFPKENRPMGMGAGRIQEDGKPKSMEYGRSMKNRLGMTRDKKGEE